MMKTECCEYSPWLPDQTLKNQRSILAASWCRPASRRGQKSRWLRWAPRGHTCSGRQERLRSLSSAWRKSFIGQWLKHFQRIYFCNETRGRIFSCVRPFYERTVSDQDSSMHRSLWGALLVSTLFFLRTLGFDSI